MAYAASSLRLAFGLVGTRSLPGGSVFLAFLEVRQTLHACTQMTYESWLRTAMAERQQFARLIAYLRSEGRTAL